MNLVLQIQKLAVDPNCDIVELLRKAYLAAKKLKVLDTALWIEYELKGYPIDKEVPKYRTISGTPKYWNPYHGWSHITFEDQKFAELISNIDFRESVPELASLISGENSDFHFPYTNYVMSYFSKHDIHEDIRLHVSKSQIVNVLESVKTKVLDWALLLEENNISGDEKTFSDDEKMRANSIPEIANFIDINTIRKEFIR